MLSSLTFLQFYVLIFIILWLPRPSVGLSQQTLFPAAVPLAVRSPYLNTWLETRNGTNISLTWPQFWNTKRILGWTGFIRVDGQAYQFLGGPLGMNTTQIKDFRITPTRTIFTLTAGSMEVTVTFLSPIEPSNLVRQSFPFSYVALNTTSNDGQRHSVQIYSDISGEWASGDNNSPLEWTLNTTTSSLFHCVHRSSPISMTEVNDIAEDSDVVLGMSKRPLASWQTGTDTILRKSFVDNGQLTSTQDNHFRAINGRDWPVFAISVDLGSILSTDSPVVYGIGLVRDPSTQVKFNDGRPDQLRSTYFWTQFKELRDGFDDFLGDYQTAYARAVGFDRKLLDEATHNVSPEYADLISLATRQALGGLEITTSQALNGSLDASDIQIFMKDIGSGGQQSRTNPVEGLFASFPMLLYLNTTWAGYALKPLLEYQYDNDSNVAAPDLGGTFPVVIAGSTSNDKRGLDDSSSMLIMSYTHALLSGDGSLISTYYNLLRRWADYVSRQMAGPLQNQVSDNVPGDKSTNLLLKGILSIQVMSNIALAMGDLDASRTYSDQVRNLFPQWRNKTYTSDGHFIWRTDDPESWGFVYSLFADKLTRSNLIEDDSYHSQANFYGQKINASIAPFGLPLSSGSTLARSDWAMLAASTIADLGTRDRLIKMVYSRANSNLTSGPFPSVYDVNTGKVASGQASAAQGAMYAILALQLPPQTIFIPSNSSDLHPTPTPPRERLSGSVIAAVVISALTGVSLTMIALFLWRRRRFRREVDALKQRVYPFTVPPPHLALEYFPPQSPMFGFSRPMPTNISKRELIRLGRERERSESSERAMASVPPSHRATSLAPMTFRRPDSEGHLSRQHSFSTYGSSRSRTVRSATTSETDHLRSAVDELRRELSWVRDRFEPPPGY